MISENTVSEQKNISYIQKLASELNMDLDYKLVKDFESWKIVFTESGDSTDFIYMPANGVIRNWIMLMPLNM